MNYDGPDERFVGHEICFNSNEDTLTIVDVSDKAAPVQLSRTDYPGATYSHQGWLTEDSRHFLLDDELDEQSAGGQTKTYTFNVERLDMPMQGPTYEGKAESIDHNMYVKGNRVFQSNYRSGLRILDASKVADGEISEAGFFDVYPEDDKPEFNGSWSNYPYFSSGTVIATGIEQGLFVLRPDAEVGGTDGTETTQAQRRPRLDAATTASPATTCAAAASRARAKRIGAAGLGRKRTAVRKSLGSKGTYRRLMDRFCLSDGSALRVGYRSPKGRATLVLTSSARTKLRGVNVGITRTQLLERIGAGRGVRVGRNLWYFRRGTRARQVFKVQGGRVREVGLADVKLTRSRTSAKRFFKSGR